MPNDRSTEARSLTEFVEIVMGASNQDTVLLRGHRCAKWVLTPKLVRLPVRSSDTLRTIEQRLVDRFRRQCLPHLQRELRDEWDTLAVAQHHGLATRLLDWTSNPLVALWFSVREPPVNEEPGAVCIFIPDEDDYPAREGTDPFLVNTTGFFRPSHLNQRIVVQSGWFSVHKYNRPRKASDRGHFSTIEKIPAFKGRVNKIVIPPDCFSDIRFQLDRFGINDATLFPDLDGLSRHLNWLESILEDEVDAYE